MLGLYGPPLPIEFPHFTVVMLYWLIGGTSSVATLKDGLTTYGGKPVTPSSESWYEGNWSLMYHSRLTSVASAEQEK